MQSTVPWRREFLSGAIAAVAFLAIYFVVRFIWQIPALPEAVIERILSFIPPALFEAVIQIFGTMAKTLNFYAILIGMVGAGGLLGLLYGRLLARFGANGNSSGGTPTALLYGLGFGGLLWLIHTVTISPFVERGFFGTDASTPVFAAVATDIIAYLAFELCLHTSDSPSPLRSLKRPLRACCPVGRWRPWLLPGWPWAAPTCSNVRLLRRRRPYSMNRQKKLRSPPAARRSPFSRKALRDWSP